MNMGQSVPKRRNIKFRSRGITQTKAHNISVFHIFLLRRLWKQGRERYTLMTVSIAFHVIITISATGVLLLLELTKIIHPNPKIRHTDQSFGCTSLLLILFR